MLSHVTCYARCFVWNSASCTRRVYTHVGLLAQLPTRVGQRHNRCADRPRSHDVEKGYGNGSMYISSGRVKVGMYWGECTRVIIYNVSRVESNVLCHIGVSNVNLENQRVDLQTGTRYFVASAQILESLASWVAPGSCSVVVQKTPILKTSWVELYAGVATS